MAKALESILGHAPLTKALRTTVSGVPKPFPEQFFSVDPANRILGDRAKYIRISGERRPAKRTVYGAPAKRRSLRDVGDATVRCLHSFEEITVDLTIMQKLRSFESYSQDEGMDWLRYQIEEAAKRQNNARVTAVASALRHGAIYWDSDGNLLADSSGADSNLTIDFSVPSTNKDQVNGIIDQSWALATTDIPGHIRALKQYSKQLTGLGLTAVLYGINVPKYMTQNEYVQAYLARGDMRDKFLGTGEIPSGLFGIKDWIPVYDSHFLNDSDTVVETWQDDLATFIPNVDQPDKMGWWAMYEGSFPVPNTLDVQREPAGTLGNYSVEYGPFSYGVLNHNPPTGSVFYGDTWLPAIRNANAIFPVDTAF